jgi:DNA relaxase NicK
MYSGFGEGDTCYIGARGGETKFLRCYDKWRQQGLAEDYRFAWRFEAELTDGHGAYALGTLEEGAFEHYEVLALLAAYWEERGISLPEVVGAHYQAASVMRKPPESIERTVKWLDTQVRPALEKAFAQGLTPDQARSILGLGPDGTGNGPVSAGIERESD